MTFSKNDLTHVKSRRDFLVHLLEKTGQLTLATSAIYSISLLSASEKNPMGGLTAGAKSCAMPKPVVPCPASTPKRCGPGFTCDTSTGTWEDNRDCSPAGPCP